MTDIEAAYLAGLIDADGSINASRAITNKRNPKYILRIVFTSTCRETVEWVAIQFGCGVSVKERNRRKPIYYTRAQNTKAKRIIQQIYPFMKTKKRQAEIALEWPLSNNGVGLNRVEVALRKLIAERLSILNHESKEVIALVIGDGWRW